MVTDKRFERVGAGDILASEKIVIDWGTTNARAYRIDSTGSVIERRENGPGISQVAAGGFPAAFAELTRSWSGPVLMAGMIGSRNGWVEAPYVECPVGLVDLARNMKAVDGQKDVFIVPGAHSFNGHRHDVMRGEEIQIFGAFDDGVDLEGYVCLPGTHSKWAKISGGRLEHFKTSMTGEVFSLLQQHSILNRLMSGQTFEPLGFDAGLERSGSGDGFLSDLFSVRAEALFETLAPESLFSYLSGIVLGHELRASIAGVKPTAQPVLVVGSPKLCQNYLRALEFLGWRAQLVSAEQATIRGLVRLSQQL